MSNVNLIVGGTPLPSYPNCSGTREFITPFSKRIAYEYSNGTYTLGWPLNPSELEYQYAALSQGTMAVGDVLMMYTIPEMHLLKSALIVVSEADASMEGASIKPVGMLHDTATNEFDTETFSLDAVVLSEESDKHYQFTPYYVPKGKTLVVGFQVVALPSDSSVSLINTIAKASIISKVDGFDIPSEV